MPNAPSSIAVRRSAFTLASSSRIAGRSSQPSAPMRSGELPTMYTTFTATRCVNMSRYCSTVDQRPGSGGVAVEWS